MGDEATSANKMHPFVPSLHRKLERSNSRYYQRFINGDSIYTCFDLGPEREFRPSTGRTIVQPHRKSRRAMLNEHGPWFMTLEAVLQHRDQDRNTLWQRRQKRKISRASRRAKANGAGPSATELEQQSAELPGQLSAEPTEQLSPENDEVDPTIPSENRTENNCDLPLDDTSEIQTQVRTPDIPSSDLLRSIHHEAMIFYDSHNVLSLPPIRAGRRPLNWEEPIAMTRALDGTALLAIAILLEEITKDQIESQSPSIYSLEGMSYAPQDQIENQSSNVYSLGGMSYPPLPQPSE